MVSGTALQLLAGCLLCGDLLAADAGEHVGAVRVAVRSVEVDYLAEGGAQGGDRKSVVEGKSVDLGGRRLIN